MLSRLVAIRLRASVRFSVSVSCSLRSVRRWRKVVPHGPPAVPGSRLLATSMYCRAVAGVAVKGGAGPGRSGRRTLSPSNDGDGG